MGGGKRKGAKISSRDFAGCQKHGDSIPLTPENRWPGPRQPATKFPGIQPFSGKEAP